MSARRVARNILSSWSGYIVSAAVTLLLTPYVLEKLGAMRYSIWLLTTSIVGYYGFLGQAFRSGSNHYIGYYLARSDFNKLNQTVSSGVTALSIIGLSIVAIGAILGVNARRVFYLPAETSDEIFWCLLAMSIATAAELAFSPYTAILVAHERFDLLNLIAIGSSLTTATAVFLVLKAGYGLIGVAIAMLANYLLANLARWRMAHTILPTLSVSLRSASRTIAWQVVSFGTWTIPNFMSQLATAQMNVIIISSFLSVEKAAPYGLAVSLFAQLKAIIAPVAQVFTPRAILLYSKDDQQGLKELYISSSRVVLTMCVIVTVTAVVWADDFFRLWLGNAYHRVQGPPSVALLFNILVLNLLGTYASGTGEQVLLAIKRVRVRAVIALCEVVLAFALSIILIQDFGLLGVAVGTALSAIPARSIAIPILVQKSVGVSLAKYSSSVIARVAVMGAVYLYLAQQIRNFNPPTRFLELPIDGAIAVSCAFALTSLIVLSSEERRRFIFAPLSDLVRRAACGLGFLRGDGH